MIKVKLPGLLIVNTAGDNEEIIVVVESCSVGGHGAKRQSCEGSVVSCGNEILLGKSLQLTSFVFLFLSAPESPLYSS